ncbi:Coatomer subunit delta [Linnemannia gamsii]|uniref:Coatomer subunit delta n=1 Tax=Linnemannia gamsii TaxID=64522 RepID=A0ABQ7K9E0_9FUNG|nr:Coatomer subunit delta [Linnemannia gamsii]
MIDPVCVLDQRGLTTAITNYTFPPPISRSQSIPPLTMLSQMWLWPEILYHLSEHLTPRDLSDLSLVCHAWYNAFAPILWANITLAPQKPHSQEPPSLETLQARASWMRSIVYQGHLDPHQFRLGSECRYLRSLTLRGTIPYNIPDSPQFDKAYSDSCRALVYQNRSTLRHLALTQMTFEAPKNRPGVPNWSPMGMFVFGKKYMGLKTLKVEGCHIFGPHRETFWVLCGRLEGLTICGGSIGLPEEVLSKKKLSGNIKAAIASSSADDHAHIKTANWLPKIMDLNLSAMYERYAEEYLHGLAAQCPRLRRLEWDDKLNTTDAFKDQMLECLTNPDQRATIWPDLEYIGLSEMFRGERLLQVVETWPIGRLHNANSLLHTATDVVVERLLDLHSGSLREIDMSRLESISSRKWMHRFLELCPLLEKVQCPMIGIQSLISEDRPPWGGHEGHYDLSNCAPKESLLHLSLRMGLDELSKLSKLKEVYFHGYQTMFQRSDVRWMVDHWVNLELVRGGSFSDKGAAFAGRKKKVWDFEYCRMFGLHHIKAISGSGPYPSDYLNPEQLAVVLAISVCTKSGKALISRQFREMTRARIEGLIASFPKLTSSGQQHTTIETDHVRYVYQPLEELFIVLITNKQSNILQDIDTLQLVSRVVSSTCRPTDAREIDRNAFELLSSFDEIISLGYRENVNLAQVGSISEMDSHEEKIQEMIEKNKEREAKEELKRRAKILDLQRKEQRKNTGGMGGGYGQGGMGGMGGGGYGQSSPMGFGGQSGMGGMGGMGNSNSNQGYNSPSPSMDDSSSKFNNPTPKAPATKARGMQLGRKQNNSDLFESLRSEVEATPAPQQYQQQAPAQNSYSAPAEPAFPMESVHVQIEEKITMIANRDGGLESMEVKGDLMLRVSDPSRAKISLALRHLDDPNIQFKTHPNVNKILFNKEKAIAFRDSSKEFPLNTPTGVLRWRYLSKDESSIPLSINCWPSPAGDGSSDVNIEYQLENEEMEFKNVNIIIPLPHGANPTVGEVDGEYVVDRQQSVLIWQLPSIDSSNASGSLEFNCEGEDTENFFPVSVQFESERLICDVDVIDVTQVADGSSVPFSKQSVLTPAEYSVV